MRDGGRNALRPHPMQVLDAGEDNKNDVTEQRTAIRLSHLRHVSTLYLTPFVAIGALRPFIGFKRHWNVTSRTKLIRAIFHWYFRVEKIEYVLSFLGQIRGTTWESRVKDHALHERYVICWGTKEVRLSGMRMKLTNG
jgi:hypothetical protein